GLGEADLVILGQQRVLTDVGEVEPDQILFVPLNSLLCHNTPSPAVYWAYRGARGRWTRRSTMASANVERRRDRRSTTSTVRVESRVPAGRTPDLGASFGVVGHWQWLA